MKIIGFVGSPRKKGNTELLVSAVLEGAKEAGASIELVNISDQNISPCRACAGCKKGENCLIEDDMQDMYYKIHEADCIIIGSPIYMWQVTAQTKAFMDRMVALLNPDLTPRIAKNKSAIMVYTQGDPSVTTFSVYFEHNTKLMEFMGFNVEKTITAGGTREPGDINKQTDVLLEARKTGFNFAKSRMG